MEDLVVAKMIVNGIAPYIRLGYSLSLIQGPTVNQLSLYGDAFHFKLPVVSSSFELR